jgi:hypothetical protein
MKLITKIPKFTVFDVWTAYDNSEIQDYTLYTVRSKKTNLLFNKRNNLMYGLVLKEYELEYTITYQKKPSFVCEDYAEIIT